jgi:hypothetical protein
MARLPIIEKACLNWHFDVPAEPAIPSFDCESGSHAGSA